MIQLPTSILESVKTSDSSDLNGILESRQAFNRLAAVVHPLVSFAELHGEQSDNDHNQTVRNEAGLDAGAVVWRILRPKDCTPDDATDRTAAYEGGRGQSPLPLAADVIATQIDQQDANIARGSSLKTFSTGLLVRCTGATYL